MKLGRRKSARQKRRIEKDRQHERRLRNARAEFGRLQDMVVKGVVTPTEEAP